MTVLLSAWSGRPEPESQKIERVGNSYFEKKTLKKSSVVDPDPYGSVSFGRIRIRVPPNTNQNVAIKNQNCPLIHDEKKLSFNISFFVKSLFFCYISEYIVNIVYMNYNLAKQLIGKTRFTELKLPRIQIQVVIL